MHTNDNAPGTDQDAGFLTFLAQVQDGRLSDELSARMKGLVATMTEQARNAGGKPKGSIKLELTFKLEEGLLEVTGDVTVKPPKMIRSRSIFYALTNGGVSVQNPKQLEMKLARDTRTPVRDIASHRATS